MDNPAALGSFNPHGTATSFNSSGLNFVSLHDWWLEKTNSRGLAIGGLASRESNRVRGFCSASIVKRHATNTLVAVDGMTITMSGFINRSRTQQNGFSSEICNLFLLGFPYNWETYAAEIFDEESTDRGVPLKISTSDKSNTSSESIGIRSLYDLPVTTIRDHFFLSVGDSENRSLTSIIFDDILRESGGPTAKNEGPSKSSSSICEETPVKSKKVKFAQNPDVNGTPSVTKAGMEKIQKFDQCEMSVDAVIENQGVRTRSKSKLSMDRINKTDGASKRGRSGMSLDVTTQSRRVSTRSMTRLRNNV